MHIKEDSLCKNKHEMDVWMVDISEWSRWNLRLQIVPLSMYMTSIWSKIKIVKILMLTYIHRVRKYLQRKKTGIEHLSMVANIILEVMVDITVS